MIRRLYQRRAWDLSGVPDVRHRKVLQGALDACSYNFWWVRKRTGVRVPVTVADLSRFAQALDPATGHAHVHDEWGTEGHLLGAPGGESPTWTPPPDPTYVPPAPRRAALGLFWLPTPAHPAGRVELDTGVMSDPDLAREVFIAEAAHAVDYGAMTDAQRVQVLALFEFTGSGTAPAGWFEERGEEGYWRWRGERFMGLFAAAFAPGLPRPLEPRQPWQWSYDAGDLVAVRLILR